MILCGDNDNKVSWISFRKQVEDLVQLMKSFGISAGTIIRVDVGVGIELVLVLECIVELKAIYVPGIEPSDYIITLESNCDGTVCLGNLSIDTSNQTLFIHKYLSSETSSSINGCYIIRTSGSTSLNGIPVYVPFVNLFLNVSEIWERLKYDDNINIPVTILLSPPSFDPSLISIFIAIKYNGILCLPLPNTRKSPLLLAQKLKSLLVDDSLFNQKVPHFIFSMTPIMWTQMKESDRLDIISTKNVILDLVFGGEEFPLATCRSDLLKLKKINGLPINFVRYWNIYGTTECSVWSSLTQIRPLTDAYPSIGNFLSYSEAKIVDDHNNVLWDSSKPLDNQTESVIGKLLLGGKYKTCLVGDEKEPLMFSGDIVKIDEEGYMIYLGREDFQTKRWGFRINLLSISTTLEELFNCPCIILNESENLICIFLWSDNCIPSLPVLMLKIRKSDLVYYSIPDVYIFVSLSKLPLMINNNGKRNFSYCKKNYVEWLIEFPTIRWGLLEFPTENDIQGITLWINALYDLHTVKATAEINNDNRYFLVEGGTSIDAARLSHHIMNFIVSLNPQADTESLRIKILQHIFHSNISDLAIFITSQLVIEMKNTKKSRVLIEYKRMRSEESQIEPLTNLPIYSTSRSKCITLNPPIIVSDFKLNIEWSVSLEKCIDASPLLVKWPNKEVIFIGSHSGLVLAINVQSHVIIWEQRLPDRIESSCVILYGKYIAVGCYNFALYVLCIDTGRIVDSFFTNGEIKCTPVFCSTNNIIWCGSHDKTLRGFTIEKTGQLKLSCSFTCEGAIFASPLLLPDCSVIIVDLKGFCFNFNHNQIIWKKRISLNPFFATPIRIDDSTMLVCGADGFIRWLNINTGSEVYSLRPYLNSGPIFSTPLLIENRIFAGNHDSKLMSVDAITRQVLWIKKLDSQIFSSLSSFKNEDQSILVVACTSGLMYFVTANGNIQKSIMLNGPLFSSPVLSNSDVFIGCRDNNCYRINFR